MIYEVEAQSLYSEIVRVAEGLQMAVSATVPLVNTPIVLRTQKSDIPIYMFNPKAVDRIVPGRGYLITVDVRSDEEFREFPMELFFSLFTIIRSKFSSVDRPVRFEVAQLGTSYSIEIDFVVFDRESLA